MKKKLETIVKNNSIFNRLYTFFGSMIVNIIGLFVRMEKNTILYVSFMGKNFNDSPKDIYEYMISNEKYKKYKHIWAFNDIDKFQLAPSTRKVKMDSFKYIITALKAEYWVTNVNIERGLHFKKRYTKYVNTWHGVPLKKVGNHVKGRNDFNFSSVDLFCYSGEYEKEIYKEAFKLKDENLYKIGMPRNDLVIKNDASIKDEVKNNFNIRNKKIILYAPTWREDNDDILKIDIENWQEKLGSEYVLLVKAHGLSGKIFKTQNEFVIDVTDYEDTNKLIVASDILITDYSSIMFDYSLLRKPIFILAKDYEKYKNTRGIYFELKDCGLPFYETSQQLLSHINELNFKHEAIKVEKFRKNFIEIVEPHATRNVVESFLSLKVENKKLR